MRKLGIIGNAIVRSGVVFIDTTPHWYSEIIVGINTVKVIKTPTSDDFDLNYIDHFDKVVREARYQSFIWGANKEKLKYKRIQDGGAQKVNIVIHNTQSSVVISQYDSITRPASMPDRPSGFNK